MSDVLWAIWSKGGLRLGKAEKKAEEEGFKHYMLVRLVWKKTMRDISMNYVLVYLNTG